MKEEDILRNYIELIRTHLQQVEQMQKSLVQVSGYDIETFVRNRSIKKFGLRKSDTYKQSCFYLDYDISERLSGFLEQNQKFKKSDVINAALDLYLSSQGF